MDEPRDLPQGEFEVMDVLWAQGQGTVREVCEQLGKTRKLAYTTVSTLLNRLKEKGYVSAEERNFAYVFKPLIPKERVVRRKLEDLVQKVLGGSLEPIAAYITENRKLTSDQIAVLEEIVKSRKEKEGK